MGISSKCQEGFFSIRILVYFLVVRFFSSKKCISTYKNNEAMYSQPGRRGKVRLIIAMLQGGDEMMAEDEV